MLCQNHYSFKNVFKILVICYKYFNCRIIYICEIGIKNNNSKNSFGFYALRKEIYVQ